MSLPMNQAGRLNLLEDGVADKRTPEMPRCPPSDGANSWFDCEVSYNGLVTSNDTRVYAYLFLRRVACKSP
jgi:hypothetical protein